MEKNSIELCNNYYYIIIIYIYEIKIIGILLDFTNINEISVLQYNESVSGLLL